MSESSFDLQTWLQQHGVSAEQANGRLFCKWLPADQLERLQAEAEGLEALIPSAAGGNAAGERFLLSSAWPINSSGLRLKG